MYFGIFYLRCVWIAKLRTIKELLSDESNAEKQDNFWARFYTVSMQVALNIVSVVFLAGTGVLMWYLLSESEHNAALADLDTRTWSMLMPLVVTLIMMIAPVFFSWIVRYENYSNPRTSLFVTLLRTYFLEIVVVGVLMAFWLKRSQDECWETSIGQEVYRLILVDFFITIIGTSLAEFVRFRIYK
ncbi:unnamed protein product [Timema podura]|uniref:TMC domain-containing protein n=1 Tax=Timema podura TaxID=61482 RepID=A0ABN7P7L7_TIMPD|nr:unnamed protein product [Timema podura]